VATINATNPTLADLAQRMDPNGAIPTIVESMKERTPLLEDMTWVEGNLPTGHVFTHRTGLPGLTWRNYNQGVAPTKSRTNQITETCGMLNGMSRVDVELANINGNAPAFRASEDSAFVQAFHHDLEDALFYSSLATHPGQIHGLSPRFDLTSGTGGEQILLHGSASGADQASIWLIVWSPETVFGIVPKGSKAGLQSKDMGEQLVNDAAGNPYRAYVTDWQWKMGLCVKDSRYVCRIANIDTGSNLATTGKLLIDSMIRASEEKVQDLNAGRAAFYVNRKIGTYLRLQALATANATLTVESVAGKPVTMLGGIPIRRTDALLNTEAVIS
jgi:hypothetical protein